MINKLKNIDSKLYPKIWCKLNIWEFPEELIEFKPKNWDLLPMLNKHRFLSPVMRYIETVIPEKELSREWNKDRYVGVDFDIWWENRQPLSEEAIEILKLLYKEETKGLN